MTPLNGGPALAKDANASSSENSQRTSPFDPIATQSTVAKNAKTDNLNATRGKQQRIAAQ